jgi:hypothetical protein
VVGVNVTLSAVVASTPSAPNHTTVTFAPTTPGSNPSAALLSLIPSPSTSYHTLLPTAAVPLYPKSWSALVWPAVRVTVTVAAAF